MSEAVVRLYGREGCGLCVEARALLARLAPRYGFRIEDVDIEQDDELHRRFMYEIPVVEAGGEVIARAPIRPGPLEAALAGVFAPRA